jgi:hypothetical protein
MRAASRWNRRPDEKTLGELHVLGDDYLTDAVVRGVRTWR